MLREKYLIPGEPLLEATPGSPPGSGLESSVLDHSKHTLPSDYPVTALGGTFDHLHAGHKILLSMAAYITSHKLIVGITGTDLFRLASVLFLLNMNHSSR